MDTKNNELAKGIDLLVEKLPGIASAGRIFRVSKDHTLSYPREGYGSAYGKPEYDLEKVSAAIDGDGIIRQAVTKKADFMFKEGYKFTSKQKAKINYIEKRFLDLSVAQDKPMELLLMELSQDFVSYHNAFLYKYRNLNNSSGKIRTVRTTKGIKEIEPVSAYYRLPPETMSVKVDKFGNPVKYLQMMPDGRYKEYSADSIIHFYHHRKAGTIIACPGIWPAIEDIRLLRKLEEAMEVLVELFSYPVFMAYVGTDDAPAMVLPDGTDEIDIYANKIQNMAKEGSLVVPHRIKVELLSPKSSIDLKEYLNYMKTRVYISLGVSGVDLGEGDTANRATADAMSDSMINNVRAYQRSFELQINHNIINELLLEGFDIDSLLPERIVKFKFNDIDTVGAISRENHASLMYSSHIITENEARDRCNMDPVVDRDGMYINTVQAVQNEQSVAAKTESESNTQAVQKNKEQPTNQHEKKQGPEKRKSSMLIERFGDFNNMVNIFSFMDTNVLKTELVNTFFSLDNTCLDSEVCIEFIDYLDNIVNESEENIEALGKHESVRLLLEKILVKIDDTI